LFKLGGSCATTVELPSGFWHHAFASEILNGGTLGVANLLNGFPVALLWREEGS
jgi:hypothetical protein